MSRDQDREAGCICMRLNPGEGWHVVARYCRSIRTDKTRPVHERYRFSNGFIPSPICLWARGANTISWGLGMRRILIFNQCRFSLSVPCIGVTSACARTLEFTAYHPRWLKGGLSWRFASLTCDLFYSRQPLNAGISSEALSINAGADLSASGLCNARSPWWAFDMDAALDRHRDFVFCLSVFLIKRWSLSNT